MGLGKFRHIRKTILIWRLKNINDKNFLLILSVLVGIIVGFAALLLKFSVNLVREVLLFFVNNYSLNYFYVIFPAIGILLTIIFINYILKKKLGHGIPMVLLSISKKDGKIPFHNVFSRIVSSSLTVGFGGSVGLEGPVVATGAAIGSNVGRFFRLDYRQIVLLICCASTAAIAAIFKAPITAIVFTLEVIMLDLTVTSLLPLILSSTSAAITSFLFSGQNYIYYIDKLQDFDVSNVVFYIILGLVAGLFSVMFSKIYLFVNNFFDKISSKWIKYIIGSLTLGAIILWFPSLYGEGYEGINMAIHGDANFAFENTLYSKYSNSTIFVIIILSLILIFKIFAVCATFIGGGVGGLFAPSLFMGSILGLLFATLCKYIGFEIPISNFALAGMAGVMAGVMHAPFTSIFLIAEITGGYSLFVPLMLVSAVSFFTTRIFMNNSIETLRLAQKDELLTHNADSNTLSMMKLEPLLEKNFLTIQENSSLRELTKIIIKSSRNIYVVVNQENDFKGIIWLDNIKEIIFNQELYDKMTVNDLMYMPNPIIEVGMNIKEIAKMFEQTDNYNIPVLQKGKYVGFISRAKLFSQYRNLLKKFSSD